MPSGVLSIVLHAHMPYVRQPDGRGPVEERWLFEAIADTYLPLLDVLLGLLRDRVPTRLALSLSPTLTAMLWDPVLVERFGRYLEALRELADREVLRNRGGAFEAAARHHAERLSRVAALHEACEGDLVSAFAALEEAGLVELMTSAATHGYLPLLAATPWAVETQVDVGIASHRAAVGRSPAGFWLPECGFSAGLDEVLARRGLAYVVLETHGVTHGSPASPDGAQAPIVCPSGLVAFGRDPECSKQVWSATEGFPADPVYREFYRDVGFELPAEELGGLAPPEGVGPLPTGLKYCRITGKTEDKEPYDPAAAGERAAAHAAAFVEARRRQVASLGRAMDRPPVLVAPFDAELFGHWWFEGPRFLDAVARRVASEGGGLELATPSDVIARWPAARRSRPSPSSWGDGGYSEVWLCEENEWVHPELHRAAARLHEVAAALPAAEGLVRRALDQALRELLLAQASDWTFLIRTGTARELAETRLRAHLEGARALLDQIEAGAPEEPLVGRLERQGPIFPWIDSRAVGVG